jgi:hypothetical protein
MEVRFSEHDRMIGMGMIKQGSGGAVGDKFNVRIRVKFCKMTPFLLRVLDFELIILAEDQKLYSAMLAIVSPLRSLPSEGMNSKCKPKR